MEKSGYNFKFVYWEITSKCNCKCSFCEKERQKLQSKDILSDKDILDVADELINMKVKSVVFSGGEPLERKEILRKLVSKFSGNKVNIFLETNGIYIDDFDIIWLKYFKKIIITLVDEKDGSNYFNEICEEQLRVIKMLLENKISVELCVVINKQNVNSVNILMDNLNELNIKSVKMVLGYFLSSEKKLDINDIHKFVQDMVKVKEKFPSVIFKTYNEEELMKNNSNSQSFKTHNLYISDSGKIGLYKFLPTYNQSIFNGGLTKLT